MTLPQMGCEPVPVEYKVLVELSNRKPVSEFVKLKNLQTLKEYMNQNDQELQELSRRSSVLIAIQKKLVVEMDEMIAKESVDEALEDKTKQSTDSDEKQVASSKDAETS